METNLFQKAKEVITNMTNMRGNVSERDKETIQQLIQDAYQEASPEEREELKAFEQQLKRNNQLL